MASLQVAEIADSSVVSQDYANSGEGERPPQLPSTFGTGGQRGNARTAASKQPLQTLVHQQWEVCWSQKLLTAVLFRKFMRTAAKGEAYSNCPAWLAPLGKRETRNWARCTL